jgi:hypothetical protein
MVIETITLNLKTAHAKGNIKQTAEILRDREIACKSFSRVFDNVAGNFVVFRNASGKMVASIRTVAFENAQLMIVD